MKLIDSEIGKTFNLKELDTAISSTEVEIKKKAEEYLKTVNNQLLVHPRVEDIHSRAHLPKWKPVLESFLDVCPQRNTLPGLSPEEKSKPCRIIGPAGSIQISEADTKEDTEAAPGVSSPSVLCTLLQHKAASLHSRTKIVLQQQHSKSLRSRCHNPVQWEPGPEPIHEETTIPPPSIISKSTEHTKKQGSTCPVPDSPQSLSVEIPENISKYTFIIKMGHISPVEAHFCHFKQSFSLCWSSVENALVAVEKLLRDFAVPVAVVSGEQLVEISHSWDSGWRRAPPLSILLSVLQNWEDVLELVSRPGQRFKGEGGTKAAVVNIQSCWRRYRARTAYLLHCRRKWAAATITISWLMHTQMCRVRKALQARRFTQLENSRCRAQHLAANWKHIRASKRTIIHIPSLGYSASQRRCLRDFDVLQNIQIGRLCDIKDENVQVIYICPLHLDEDLLHYYTSVLKSNSTVEMDTTGANEQTFSKRRFIILTPEAVDYFPIHSMCLSSLLKYSPQTLQRIRRLIQGKHAYIVAGVAHVDDLAVAEELGVPVLGPEPAVAHMYGTKSAVRRLFAAADIEVPPGEGDIYSLNQLYETLAELMAQNLDVQRWLFKIDYEHGGRGIAFCDICHLSCYPWALGEYRRYGPDTWRTKWIQESVLLTFLKEIPEWLSCYARPAKISHYPSWACFLKTFLRQGGVVEAYPPSDSVTCLTVDLLVEPGGQVTMLSCGDQLRSSSHLEALGSSVPQTSVNPETLHSICMRVGRACQQHRLIGHVSVDLATFLNHDTKEHKVWALDLDLTYSDHLAMTQLLLLMTKGRLNCRTGSLEVLMPSTDKSCEKLPIVKNHAVLSSKLFHANLSMLYHSVFFKMCKVHGIGYNSQKKQGTVFALYDSTERSHFGMITVSENLQGALVTFAQNLSVIHQEISSSKTQGETNFKELIKDIEGVLQKNLKNKVQAVVNKTTP